MFDHVTIRSGDGPAVERFYTLVLQSLGTEISYRDDVLVEWDDFSLMEAGAGRETTRSLHIGFAAPSRDHVDAFWQVGTEAGFENAGDPGERPQYKPDYYGAFLRDPNGNGIEAVHHGSLRTGGVIDHVWLRASDPSSSRRFYETIASAAGFEVRYHPSDHLQVVGPTGSFSVVPGPPTRGLHMAFPAATDAAVREFHRLMIAAGFADDGAPGERPAYHAGYYAAFVLDPDGNSIELVNHNRSGGG